MRLRFAWRYLRAGRSTQAVQVIAWVCVLAITVGTASLIVILSAFNGFEGLVRSLYGSYYAQIRIEPAAGRVLRMRAGLSDTLRRHPAVKAFCTVAEQKGMLRSGEYQVFVLVKGVDPTYPEVSGLPAKVFRGRYATGSADRPFAVLGAGVENAVGVLSDRSLSTLTLYMPRSGVTDLSDPLAALSQDEVMPVGSFAIQPEFDNKLLVTDIGFVRRQMHLGDAEGSAVEVALRAGVEAEVVGRELSLLLGDGYRVLDRYAQNRNLYATIRMEKWAIYAIFSLILLVAAFNMVGALSMLVLEKRKDIQVLQAMGAEPRLVRGIFLTEGLLLTGIGMSIGMALAFVLCQLQLRYGIVPLEGRSFLIDHYPVDLRLADFVLVGGMALGIGTLAAWFPAAGSARQPLDLRN
jgi:lipoprotein-releasing system permease protein